MKRIMHRRNFLSISATAPLWPAIGHGTPLTSADAPMQPPARRPAPIMMDAEHVQMTVPLPGVEIFAMPQAGLRTDTRTAMTKNGDIYVGGGGFLWKSTDRGETWTMRTLPQRAGGGFGIVDGDVFLLVLYAPDNSSSSVLRSTDYGETWSEPAALDTRPYNFSGGGWSHVYQHPDGTAMLTVTLRQRDQPGFHDYIFRSPDNGVTWGDPTLLIPYSAESSLLALRDSSRMLAYIRAQRHSLPEDPPGFWKQTGATEGHSWPLKNGVVAQSNDGGRTWKNLRLFDTYGSVPGELIQTPGGRVAAIWLQRYPYTESDIRVRISNDGGRSWGQRTYSLFHAHGYPSSVVFSDGAIVTVCESTRMNDKGRPIGERAMAAVRWRLPSARAEQ